MIGCQVTVPGENPRRAGGACVTREPRATAGGCGLLARRVGRGLRAASTCSGTAARLQVEVPPRPPDRAGCGSLPTGGIKSAPGSRPRQNHTTRAGCVSLTSSQRLTQIKAKISNARALC